MRVAVSYLGPTASFSGTTSDALEFDRPVTVKDIIDIIAHLHGYRFDGRAWAVLINGRGIPTQRWETTCVTEDSQVTILPLLSGG
jgi:sulfur carrier protein ThiS